MRFTMGRYIAELDAEGRDRLIAAPEFNDGASWWYGGCGCLVGTGAGCNGTASIWEKDADEARRCYSAVDSTVGKEGTVFGEEVLAVEWGVAPASVRYPQAVRRFGMARVVRAVKLRAARVAGCDPETIRALLDNPASVGVEAAR